jgi:hypothetical protein
MGFAAPAELNFRALTDTNLRSNKNLTYPAFRVQTSKDKEKDKSEGDIYELISKGFT